jgi:Siphovirus ReqiPepy6 Gp37-like protein
VTMDLVHLDPNTFLPDYLVEDYESLIWTERFSALGEFELKTAKIQKTMTQLPMDSMVSLVDTDAVMLVETYTLDRDDDGRPLLTVRGHSFESFLQKRVMLSPAYKTPWKTLKPYTASEFISVVMWNAIVNNTGEDPTRNQSIPSQDSIPATMITDGTTVVSTAESWMLETSRVDKVVIDQLNRAAFGVRSVRPGKLSNGYKMEFDVSHTASRGTVTKTLVSNISQLRLDVYNGLDRTTKQTMRAPVIFHWGSGHIDSPQYLISNQDHRNLAIVTSSVADYYLLGDEMTEPSGLKRKVLLVDAGAIADTTSDDAEILSLQKGLAELRKHDPVRYFDGEISLIAPYTFKQDYFLGDAVTLIGEFGIQESMIVGEYIRTEDSEGERGYPGMERAVWEEPTEGVRRFRSSSAE